MCLSYLRLWLTVKPRSLTRGTGERESNIIEFKFVVLLEIPLIISSSVFDALNSIEISSAQRRQASMSDCRMQGSKLRVLLSSANRNVEKERHNGQSLIKTVNKSRPKIDP